MCRQRRKWTERGWFTLLSAVFVLAGVCAQSRPVDWSALVARAQSSVVRVFAQSGRYTTCGSGVVVSQAGYVLTAGHVIENARTIKVVVEGRHEYEASVVRVHEWTDLAVLRVPDAELTPLRLEIAERPVDGAEICVLGYPECGLEPLAVQGRVGRRADNEPRGMVWYNAPVRRGQSGGAVLDVSGSVIAVHFEQPAAEGGGRGVSAGVVLSVLPSGVPFVVSLAGNIVTVNWAAVSDPVEPGDVIEVDPARPGSYRKASGPCASSVAGVVFGNVGLQPLHGANSDGRVLVALMGIVPVKVTDENGPIRVGDLLVASSTPGHATRWDPEGGCGGGFVGKALEAHETGQGMILVLLMR